VHVLEQMFAEDKGEAALVTRDRDHLRRELAKVQSDLDASSRALRDLVDGD
jgi:hypothetical protein